ncbi:hypothetical protein PPYR_12525 [Photinus pyralis]|uniref:Uncharacterized protein n=1 Tax=Photinus pyralis TaxID=7054 RepID=A0A1Y1KCY9_PHOPY|nr:uncharacterized protein LOC116177761 [Photinus pyralis]KAB0792905.1 hypothetical protein PPYR_12525 [Photinus pyralis]
MAAALHFITVTCLTLTLVHVGSSLRCFSCSSAREDYCDDTFSFHAQTTVPVTICENSPALSIPGAGPNTHCGKTKKKNGDTPNDYVFRGCVPENYCRLVKSQVEDCEICETDKCNGSSTLLPSVYVAIVVYLLFVLNCCN